MNLERLPVSAVRPAPWNPRQISVEAKARLLRSLETYGQVEPLLVDETGMLLGGHQRFACMVEMGFESVEVVRREGLTEAQKKALAVALNNDEAQGEWHLGKLADILADVLAADLPVDLTGFDEAFAEGLLGQGSDRKLRGLEIKPPRKFVWIVAAIEQDRFPDAAPLAERLAALGICEVMQHDQGPPDPEIDEPPEEELAAEPVATKRARGRKGGVK